MSKSPTPSADSPATIAARALAAARAASQSPERRSEVARQAARVRWPVPPPKTAKESTQGAKRRTRAKRSK